MVNKLVKEYLDKVIRHEEGYTLETAEKMFPMYSASELKSYIDDVLQDIYNSKKDKIIIASMTLKELNLFITKTMKELDEASKWIQNEIRNTENINLEEQLNYLRTFKDLNLAFEQRDCLKEGKSIITNYCPKDMTDEQLEKWLTMSPKDFAEWMKIKH